MNISAFRSVPFALLRNCQGLVSLPYAAIAHRHLAHQAGERGTPAVIERVVEQLADRLSKGEFGGAADRTQEQQERGGASGNVSFDYNAVPRNIDIESFRRALVHAFSRAHVPAGPAGPAPSGADSVTENVRLQLEKNAHAIPREHLSKLLSDEPVPVVRSRLADMLKGGTESRML